MSQLPSTFRRLLGTKLTPKFSEAVEIVTSELKPPGPGQVLIKTKYAGINASDINFTAGRYQHATKPPILLGFEGVGRVAQVGPKVDGLSVGQPVAYLGDGSFTEYHCLPARSVFPVPDTKPQYVSLLVSGLTAALALEKVGEMKKGDSVLVTGAAGGTGQFAVQLAKISGCRVAGVCSSAEKADVLRQLGCDLPIVYTEEKVSEAVKRHFKGGADIVYEGVGGSMFDEAVECLALRARIVVIGFIQGYQSDVMMPRSRHLATLPARLLLKSASVRGFFLFHFVGDVPKTLLRLVELLDSGQLRAVVDMGERHPLGPFRGLESVTRAVEHLYSKQSVGKIVVDLDPEPEAKL